MIAASNQYVRVLVRVPEAYLLVRALDATRPGLLVLDADGRRVDSIAFPGMGAPPIDAATIAKRLTAARSTTAVELWRLRLSGEADAVSAVHKELAKRPGVHLTHAKSAPLKMRVTKGALNPETLTSIARERGVTIAWQEPVPIQVDPKTKATVAGAWQFDPTRSRAFVTSLLLDPTQLPKGWGTDLETKTYLLPGIPKGGNGSRVALAPTAIAGVVSIFADIFNERQVVVARKGAVNWKAVKQAFVDEGCAAHESGKRRDDE